MTTRRSIATLAVAVAGAAMIAACGGDSGGATPAPTPTPPPAIGGTTITITASGVSPKNITVAVGMRVVFVNNDSRNHEMASDPHPEHTQCLELKPVGFIQPNRTGITENLNTVGTCGYHDHNQPTNTSLQGTIRIQ